MSFRGPSQASASLSACSDALSRFSTQREHLQDGQAGRLPRPGQAHVRPLRRLLEAHRLDQSGSGAAPGAEPRALQSIHLVPDQPAYELRLGRPKLFGPEISHRLLISLPSSTLLRPPSGPVRGAPRVSF
jgi:hypothetical protein